MTKNRSYFRNDPKNASKIPNISVKLLTDNLKVDKYMICYILNTYFKKVYSACSSHALTDEHKLARVHLSEYFSKKLKLFFKSLITNDNIQHFQYEP